MILGELADLGAGGDLGDLGSDLGWAILAG